MTSSSRAGEFSYVETAPLELTPPFVITISASRGSGKSTLIRRMLDENLQKQFHYIVFVSPTLDLNDDYKSIDKGYCLKLPKPPKPPSGVPLGGRPPPEQIVRISNTVDFDRAIKEIMATQTDIVKEHGKKKTPQVLIIADDVIDSKILRFGGNLDKIAERGRHMNISLIISTQRITSVSRSIRLNSDFFIVFRPWNYTEVERWLSEFIPRKKRAMFEEWLNSVFTEPYMFLVVNNRTKSIDERFYVGFDTLVIT